ncbi:hypothetical protein B0H16DRAFT_496031 [Mycena metata]|uniref:DUF6697 domain-containing protein n=1 Tax=Mycena metata TaxID=1033252 RepID=A0AAD7HAE5_9AGAR|nr:hypothetical protein B0H16DRAFT_496031 [Mycena metata]
MDIKPKIESIDVKKEENNALLLAYAERGAELQRLRDKLNSLEGRPVEREVIEIEDDENLPEDREKPSPLNGPPVKQEVIEISDDEGGPEELIVAASTISEGDHKFEVPAATVGVVIPSKRGGSKRPLVIDIEEDVLPRALSVLSEAPDEPATDEASSNSSGQRPAKRRKTRAAPKNNGNSRVKKEDKTVVLPQDAVAAYLSASESLEIKPPPRPENAFSRKFLRKHFGFQPQKLLFNLKQKAALPPAYAGRAVICPTLEKNPYLPARPGAPGLMCSVRQRMLNGAPWSVFLRLPHKMDNQMVWFYFGEYTFEIVPGSLTPAEFTGQSDGFQSSWAKNILDRVVDADDYVRMRARIGLRKRGHATTEDNVAVEMAQIRQKKSTNRRAAKVTKADVIGALTRGEERIPLVRMKCISYDHEFAQALVDVRVEYPGRDGG